MKKGWILRPLLIHNELDEANMHTFFKVLSCCVLIALSFESAYAGKEIFLPHKASAEVSWSVQQRQYFSPIWETEVITNVAKPSLVVFEPETKIANGTAVVIAPGGALYAHSITSEGYQVAEWLASRGVTAFVLKYRLVPTGEDGVKEATDDWQGIEARVKPVLPLSISDGLAAVEYVRSNADGYGVAPDKIGFMGFSAGGTVTMGVSYGYSANNRPDFIVPIYPWTAVLGTQSPPLDAPPMLVICASDDPLGLAPASVELYSQWLAAGKSAALHMYSRGGHGFGMRTLGLPSDKWIERFYDWAIVEGFVEPR